MSSHQHIAVTMAALLLLSVVALPGTVIAAEPAVNDADRDLAIDVSQNETVTVTVTDDGTTVDEMNLTVAPVESNETYTDAGNYTGDGEVELAQPDGNESVELEFVAAVGNATAETTETIEGDETDEDGAEESDVFGALVSQFVAENQNETEGPLGQVVSSFVVENNPGNAPDHAGPPEHAGSGESDGGDETSSQGPPAHAGPGDDVESDEDEADDDDNGGGPPSHAGPNDDD